MKTRRDEIVSQLHQLQNDVDVVMNFLRDDKVMKTMETMRDPKTLSAYLNKEFNVSVAIINYCLLLYIL
jgi:translation initiation factor 3 subunit E